MTAEIIYGMPFGEYREIDALNGSLLFHADPVLGSPLAYRDAADGEDADTPARAFGRLLHTAILEPALLSNYIIWEGERRTKQGREDYAELLATGKQIVTASDINRAKQIAGMARSNPDIAPLLDGGHGEVTILWTHRSGRKMKARIDYLGGVIVDLKSAADIDDYAFFRNAYKLGYDFKAAGYMMAVAAATGKVLPYKLVVVQSGRPYDSRVIDVPMSIIDSARQRYERAIEIVGECERSGEWPGR